MHILKFMSKGRLLLSEFNLITILTKSHSEGRYYSDHKCDEVSGKHRLVPCRESDTVTMCLTEPLYLGPSAKMPAPCTENYFRVIIVGGGIAGLSAGARFINSGLQDFIILEAKDKPGGRIKTRKLGGSLIELGAEFIEGASIANSIYQLSCINGLITEKSPKIEFKEGIFLFSDCRAVEASPKVLKTFRRILDNIRAKAAKGLGTDQNVFNYIEDKMKMESKYFKEWEQDDAMRMTYSLTNELRSNYGIDLSTVTMKNFGSLITLPGYKLRVDNGAIGIIKSLLKQMPKEKVLCNKGVQTIWWCEGTDGIRIRCLDGTEYKACHVIVTVSLGVLRTQNCLFCPPLPPEKIQAIRDIPFGKATKLFMRYKEPFWMDPNLAVRFGWLKEELADRQDWVKGIGVIEELPSSTDHILRVIVGGREADCAESCPNIAVDLFRWLNSTVGTPLPLPTEVVISKWNNDLFTGGSASFSAPALQSILAQPLPTPNFPTLLFAGEATVPGYVGSMDAAAKSGVREADRIVGVIKRYSEENERLQQEYERQMEEYDREETASYESSDCK